MKKVLLIVMVIAISLTAVWQFVGVGTPQASEVFKSYDTAGVFGPVSGTETIHGDVVIKTSGIILQNVHITGNLFFERIAGGIIELNNVAVDGNMVAVGGQGFSVSIRDSKADSFTVSGNAEEVRIVLEGSTDIFGFRFRGPVRLEVLGLTGNGFGEVLLQSPHLFTLSGNMPFLNAQIRGAQIALESGVVDYLLVDEGAEDTAVRIEAEATVILLELNSRTFVSGSGQILTAIVNAKDSVLAIAPVNLSAPEGTTAEDLAREVKEDDEGKLKPVILFPITPLNLAIGETATRSLSGSPAGIEFVATSANTNIVSVVVKESTLTATAIAPGTVRVNVRGSHPDHRDASIGINVTVYEPRAASPTASHGSGEVPAGTTISLSSRTTNARIYFTTDGSNPSSGSMLYSIANRPVVNKDMTLKAVAVFDGMAVSETVTWNYKVQVASTPVEAETEPEESQRGQD